MRDVIADIIDYEEGNMSSEDETAFFQRLVDIGLAWKLQGSYGRKAEAMIKAGLISTGNKGERHA